MHDRPIVAKRLRIPDEMRIIVNDLPPRINQPGHGCIEAGSIWAIDGNKTIASR
jgi:hypothetical protein